jgi:hypothetical protein
VKEFLDTINYQENYDLALTTRTKDGMVLFFDADDGTPKPVQLGHIDNRESLDLLETHIPLPKEGDDDWTKSCERGAFDIFHKKVHDGFMSFKKRKQKPKRPLTPMEKAIAGCINSRPTLGFDRPSTNGATSSRTRNSLQSRWMRLFPGTRMVTPSSTALMWSGMSGTRPK